MHNIFGKTPLTTAHMTARTHLLTDDMHRPCTSSRLARVLQHSRAHAHTWPFQAHSGLMAQQSITTSRATAGSTGVSSKPLAAAQRSYAQGSTPCPGYTLIHGTHWRDVAIRRSPAVLPLPGTACPSPQLTTQDTMHCNFSWQTKVAQEVWPPQHAVLPCTTQPLPRHVCALRALHDSLKAAPCAPTPHEHHSHACARSTRCDSLDKNWRAP